MSQFELFDLKIHTRTEDAKAYKHPDNSYKPIPPERKPTSQHAPGWVYLFGFPTVGAKYYKIGLSKNPWSRLQQTKADWNQRCVILCACGYVDNMAKAETHLHAMYADYYASGQEYFLFPDVALADFVREVHVLALDSYNRMSYAKRAQSEVNDEQ